MNWPDLSFLTFLTLEDLSFILFWGVTLGTIIGLSISAVIYGIAALMNYRKTFDRDCPTPPPDTDP